MDEDDLPEPVIGKRYMHFRGTIYTVIGTAILCDGDNEGQRSVVYQRPSGETFVRSLPNWHSEPEPGLARFLRV